MAQQNKPDKPHKQCESGYPFEFDPIDIVSATDYTGMIPTPPLDDDCVANYMDICPVPQQKAENAQKASSPEEQGRRSDPPAKENS